MTSIYDIKVNQIDGNEQQLDEYKGKVMLIVNTASKCGFTPQFSQLQTMYSKYNEQAFTILGFPCDQFANQEYSQIDDTMQFCEKNYGVTFPMFAKVNVNGKKEHPLYTYLKQQKGGLFGKAIKWNFTKFLINRDGEVIKRYAPMTKIEQIEQDILALIKSH